MSETRPYNPYVSIDCVVFGFDGKNLKVLLIKRHIDENTGEYNDVKLPGSIIYMDEDLDEAATRVLAELTGLKNIPLSQFYSFGNPLRTSNPLARTYDENQNRTNSHYWLRCPDKNQQKNHPELKKHFCRMVRCG